MTSENCILFYIDFLGVFCVISITIKKGGILVLTDYMRAWQHDDPTLKIEYGPLDILWKLVRYSGVDISRAAFFSISGYPSTFFYSRDVFWVYDILRSEVIRKAANLSGVNLKAFTPESIDDALNFFHQSIGRGVPVYASWFEPILVYGLEGSSERPSLKWHNSVFAPDGLSWNREDIENNWWKWTEESSMRVLLTVEKGSGYKLTRATFISVLREFHEGMKSGQGEKNNTWSGFDAIRTYAADMKNPEIDFTIFDQESKLNRVAWMDFAIYSQWTQFIAIRDFIQEGIEVFPELKLTDVRDNLSEVIYHWSEWEGKIGRLSDEELFIRRIADLQIRIHAALSVERSLDALRRALEALENFLKGGL